VKPRARHPAPQWPFWLLIAAWVCANSPQAAVYPFVSWLAEAPHFSHQHRLSTEVTRLLAGAPDATRAAQVASTPRSPATPRPTPAVPPEAVLKQLPLSLENVATVLPPPWRSHRPAARSDAAPESLRAAPPHGPPRAVPA
jgi:hypothetical protein